MRTHLDLFGRGLEGVDLDDLLEPVEGDDDEGVLHLLPVALPLGNVMDEEPVQGDGLTVDDVAVEGQGPQLPPRHHHAPLPTRVLPVLRQRRLLLETRKSR